MDEDGFDPCKCIWSHQMAVRRLLSLLRQSQAYCTDNECLTELPGSDISSPEQNFFFIALCWFLFAMLLYFLRPNTFRRKEDMMKLRNNENDSSNNSSDPPPLC